MSIPADPFDDMLATITTVMQCAAQHDGQLRELCGVRVLTMDSQTEPIRAFFSNDELAEYLRT